MFRELFKPATQTLAIFTRFGETIDVIDSHAVDQPFSEQPENQRMRCLEHFRALDAHAAERADVEETAPVHFIRGGAPPREPVMLPFQQPMQSVAANGVIAGMRLHGGVNGLLTLGGGRVLFQSVKAARASSARGWSPGCVDSPVKRCAMSDAWSCNTDV